MCKEGESGPSPCARAIPETWSPTCTSRRRPMERYAARLGGVASNDNVPDLQLRTLHAVPYRAPGRMDNRLRARKRNEGGTIVGGPEVKGRGQQVEGEGTTG